MNVSTQTHTIWYRGANHSVFNRCKHYSLKGCKQIKGSRHSPMSLGPWCWLWCSAHRMITDQTSERTVIGSLCANWTSSSSSEGSRRQSRHSQAVRLEPTHAESDISVCLLHYVFTGVFHAACTHAEIWLCRRSTESMIMSYARHVHA